MPAIGDFSPRPKSRRVRAISSSRATISASSSNNSKKSPMRKKGISFPKDTLCVALNCTIFFSQVKSFLREAAVCLVEFNADIRARQFFRYNGGGTRAEKWVKDELTRKRTGEDQFS